MLTLAAGVPSGFAQQRHKQASLRWSCPPTSIPLTCRRACPHTQPPDLRRWAGLYQTCRPSARQSVQDVQTTDFGEAGEATGVAIQANGKILVVGSIFGPMFAEDFAIARYNLDIADTDILRTRTGAAPLGAPAGLLTNTLGGSVATLASGGGPGGTSVGSGGAGSGLGGQSFTTSGAGPVPRQNRWFQEPSVRSRSCPLHKLLYRRNQFDQRLQLCYDQNSSPVHNSR
jgi:hypothetical protein